MFSEEGQKELERMLSRYPIKRNALLPLLHLAQQENGGWLSEESIKYVAEICEVSETHVEGVISFYTMYRLKKAREISSSDLYLRSLLPGRR